MKNSTKWSIGIGITVATILCIVVLAVAGVGIYRGISERDSRPQQVDIAQVQSMETVPETYPADETVEPAEKGIEEDPLTEQEKNAYGADARAQLLSDPGLILQLFDHTKRETYAYVDLDGDDVAEKISFVAEDDGNTYDIMRDAHFVLKVDDSALDGWAENLYNDLYAVSVDGEEILLALYADGPSSDSETLLYAYRDGELQKVGELENDIRYCRIEDGFIYGAGGNWVIQSVGVDAKWRIGDHGELEWVEQDTYEFAIQNDVTLLVNLPVHSAPDMDSESHEVQPQTVKFIKTDSSFTWVYLEAEDGDSGWFKVERGYLVTELFMDSQDVFDNLILAG